jgi:hypothetical protein
MHLFEQIYRTNRIYWHGSYKYFREFKYNNKYDEGAGGGMLFLSTKREFALKFVIDDPDTTNTAYLYMCKLIRPLDIFNIASDHDIKKVGENLKGEDLEYFKRQIDFMRNNKITWRTWTTIEYTPFVKTYIDLGYDGIAINEDGIENLGIFGKSNSIKILKREIVSLQDDFEDDGHPYNSDI